MGHGWPTSSWDFQGLSQLLELHLQVCTVDYVGAGFSEKPAAPFKYHIEDHAQAILALAKDRGLKKFSYLTHDEGSSVGFRVLQILQEQAQSPPFELTHHFVLDGSIYLPLANLTDGQKLLLSNVTGPATQRLMDPAVLALDMSKKVWRSSTLR
jgi:pimeloyl-ACP methyl ester carboxylesterase